MGRSAAAWLAERVGRHALTAETAWIVILVCAAGLVHAFNMFDFPYYETDEGTYMSQAWAVLAEGKLAPYTYWYDHAPLGWIQLAGWALVTGGFFTFGTAVESGRFFMFLVHVVSVFVLYRIARDISGQPLVATIAVVAFSFSSYGIYYHRRVLLDNIATLWVLISLWALVSGRLSLTRVWLSAFALGIAALSKEVTVFLIPAFAAIVLFRSDWSHRLFAAVGWLTITAALFSSWVLMALLKNELFPTGTAFGGSGEHVSLIESLQFQMSRGKDGGLFDAGSRFWEKAAHWIMADPLLVVAGTAAAIGSLIMIWSPRHRVMGCLGLATLSLWGFLARGGEVLPFYLLPLLPFLSLNLALALGLLLGPLRRGARALRMALIPVQLMVAAAVGSAVVASYMVPQPWLEGSPTVLWTGDQALAQKQALDWVERNVSTDSALIIDNFMWTDLRANLEGGQRHQLAHWYYKVDLDPAVRDGVFENRWEKVDYVVTTWQMLNDAQIEKLDLVSGALKNSYPVVRFETGGWPIEVRQVAKFHRTPAPADTMLARTWVSYKERFIQRGRVIDPQANGVTTSEGQSYALLRAVYMNDRRTFDEVWSWTRQNLQVRGDGLFAWRWGADASGAQTVLDVNAATDADQDIALALLFASRRWGEPGYQHEAVRVLDGIWEQETVEVGNRRVVVAGNWARGGPDAEFRNPVVNPSYFAPYAYRIFAEGDPSRPWNDLVDSSYDVLRQIHAREDLGGAVGLVPNWVMLDAQTGAPVPADQLGDRAREFSWDASRVPWRLGMDWIWFRDSRAVEAVQALGFPRWVLESEGQLKASYTIDGRPSVEYEALSMYATTLPTLLLGGDVQKAHRVFAEKIAARYTEDAGSVAWGDPHNYYEQNWAWFTTALMHGGFANLWAGETVIEWDHTLAGVPRAPGPPTDLDLKAPQASRPLAPPDGRFVALPASGSRTPLQSAAFEEPANPTAAASQDHPMEDGVLASAEASNLFDLPILGARDAWVGSGDIPDPTEESYTVSAVAHSLFSYQPAGNHDLDSNGTSFAVLRPAGI